MQLTFDPNVVTRDTVLKMFFTIHDPTTLNSQGPDHCEQYRSVAFYRDDAQKAAIEKAIKETADSHEWSGSIVTQLTRHRLIDEYQFVVSPILLGKGLPLLDGSDARQALKLMAAKSYESGVVVLRYGLA